MNKKNETEILIEYIPILRSWSKLLVLYLFQFFIFILVLMFFWWISSKILLGAIFGQLIISIFLVFFFVYIANNSVKIRERYRKKYGKLAGQYFWLKYLAYINPIVSASFYFPILLKTDYFLPAIVSLPSHFITNSIFPFFIALPIGILIIILGLLIKKPSGDYSIDIDSYLYMIYPEKGKLIKSGMYRFIRNPQYLGRGIIAIGFGFFANNVIGVFVGLIHFLSYIAIIPAEDREMLRRFESDFKSYSNKVPILLPKIGNWIKFIRYVFTRRG